MGGRGAEKARELSGAHVGMGATRSRGHWMLSSVMEGVKEGWGSALALWGMLQLRDMSLGTRKWCRAPFVQADSVVTMATRVYMVQMASQTCLARRAHLQQRKSGVWQLVKVV